MVTEGVVGGHELDDLARHFRAAAAGGLQREIQERLRDAGQRLRPTIGRSALSMLPSGGGLARLVARADVDVDDSGDTGLTITVSGSLNLAAINAGRLSHPTYGHEPWVTQDVPEGFADKPIEEHRGEFERAVEDGITEAGRNILRGL